MSPTDSVLACCLAWRWAHSRDGEDTMLSRLNVSPTGRRLWQDVRALVEKSWTAPDTASVIEIARQILEKLSLGTNDLPEGWEFGMGDEEDSDDDDYDYYDDDEFGEGDDEMPPPIVGRHIEAADPDPDAAKSLPKSPYEGEQPGKGTDIDEDDLPDTGGDKFVSAAPYTDLENQVAADANRLAEALKMPNPRVRTSAHAWRGRYSFRQELRTPDTPNRVRSLIGKSSRDVVIYVLVDRSGSMSSIEDQVQRALMTLYLASTRVGVPIGITYFGDNGRAGRERETFTFEVTPVSARPDELVKAYIAGYRGATGAEYLHWGLMDAKDALTGRREKRKFLLVIHDEEPVYKGSLGNDREMSKEDVSSLERLGITPIGIFLGQEAWAGRLAEIFPRLVIVEDAKTLPNKLGDMLRSLI